MAEQPHQLKPISTKDIFGDPNDFLDRVLTTLVDATEEHPLPREVIFMRVGVQPSVRDMHIVIQKLIKDGYADKIIKDNAEQYFITFEGIALLRNQAGHTGLAKKVKYEIRKAELRDNVLSFGSVLAGVGTTGLFLMEILKYCDCEVTGLSFAIAFLFVCCSVVVFQVLFSIQRRRRREQ